MMAVKDVGFCAHFSHQGDWAFQFAFTQAKRLKGRLNIFYFPQLDWTSSGRATSGYGTDRLVALDRRVREYYDDKLEDFVDVGFRVCEDVVDTELRRCLFRREYQVMVLAYLDFGAPFGKDPVESFAYRFNGPLVLVGPYGPDEIYLNPPARLVSWQLGMADDDWMSVPAPGEVGVLR
jgi:hypothetical protein